MSNISQKCKMQKQAGERKADRADFDPIEIRPGPKEHPKIQ
jgi:hypothetical protein